MDNTCPLCGKQNPATEWACEECGAKLPLHGVRAAPVAPAASTTPVAALKPTPGMGSVVSPNDSAVRTGRCCGWGCGALLLIFVVLPLGCSLLAPKHKPVPTYTTAPNVAPGIVPNVAPGRFRSHRSRPTRRSRRRR
jgi:hypothetical protein